MAAAITSEGTAGGTINQYNLRDRRFFGSARYSPESLRDPGNASYINPTVLGERWQGFARIVRLLELESKEGAAQQQQ